MATPVVKSTPGGRTTTWQKPISLRRGDPLPAALAPKKEEPPRRMLELTSHLRPAEQYHERSAPVEEEQEHPAEPRPRYGQYETTFTGLPRNPLSDEERAFVEGIPKRYRDFCAQRGMDERETYNYCKYIPADRHKSTEETP